MATIVSRTDIKSSGEVAPAQASQPASNPAPAPKAAAADTTIRSSGPVSFCPSAPRPEGGAEHTRVASALQDLAAAPAFVGERVVIWTAENSWTSRGQTRSAAIPGVNISADGVRAQWVHVSGATAVTSIDDQPPFEAGQTVTRDAFDQAQLVADSVFMNQLQSAVGIDNNRLWIASVNPGVLRTKANAIPALDAVYQPITNDISFGTANGRWHLASDRDVTRHETGHARTDKQNPAMFHGEGGAMHEGYFGDFAAAIIAGNPFIAEDFGNAIGRPGQPLRNLDNDLPLSRAGGEVHDRGQAYGGLGWRVTQALGPRVGGLARACQVMLHVAFKTGYYFTTKTPTPRDFIDALARCVRDSLPRVVDAATIEFILQAIKAEGVKREMIPAGWVEPALVSPDPKTRALSSSLAAKGVGVQPSDGVRSIEALWGTRPDRRIRVVKELLWKSTDFAAVTDTGAPEVNSRKVFMQLEAVDPRSGKVYPVEDGYMTTLASDDVVSVFAGGGRRILDQGDAYAFDFTPIPQDRATLVAKAQAAIARFIAKDLGNNPYLSQHLAKTVPGAFAAGELETDEVMFGGKLCLQITTPVGKFIYDHANDTVTASQLAVVDLVPERQRNATKP